MEIRDKIVQTQVRETGSKVTSQTPKTKKTAEKIPQEKTRLSKEARRSDKTGKPSNLKELQQLVAQGMNDIGGDGLSPQQLQEKKEALVSMGALQDLVNPEMVAGLDRIQDIKGTQAFLPFATPKGKIDKSLSEKLLPNRETQVSFREAFDLIEAGEVVNFKPYVWKVPRQYESDNLLSPDKSSHRYSIKVHDFKGLNKLAQEAIDANPKVTIRPPREEKLTGKEIFQEMKEKAEKVPRNALMYQPMVKNRLGRMSKISYEKAALRLKAHKPVTFQPLFDRFPDKIGMRHATNEDFTAPLGTIKFLGGEHADLITRPWGTKVKGTEVTSFDDLKEMRAVEQNYLRLEGFGSRHYD